MQLISERHGAAFEVSARAGAVFLFLMRGAGVFVGHAVPQGGVEQHGDLARYRLARPCCQSSVEGTQGQYR